MLCPAAFAPDNQAALSTFCRLLSVVVCVVCAAWPICSWSKKEEVDRRGDDTSKGRQTEPPADPVQANALLTLPSVKAATAATQVATSDSRRGCGEGVLQPKAVATITQTASWDRGLPMYFLPWTDTNFG